MGEMKNALWWWGYLHQNGTIQCKRWFGDKKDYTDDCQDNPFVIQVVEPFIAPSREAAVDFIKARLGQKERGGVR